MVERYGEIAESAAPVTVRGIAYRPRQILARWMMDVPEVWTMDAGRLEEDRYWVRFLDADDRYVVAFEFDGDFQILSEMRVDSLAWEGEKFFTSRTR
jgi:hypothetical protein